MRSFVTAVLALFMLSDRVVAADKAPRIPKQVQQLIAMTPEDFGARIKITDDDLETSAEISTIDGWQQKSGLLQLGNGDQFLRAFINKKSGKVSYQVYQYVNYYGDWAFFNLVNFETPEGPVQKELTVISRDVLGCTRYLGCQHVEHVGFDVEESLLRVAASKYKPGALEAWRFRLKAKSGVQRDEGIVAAEIIALLRAVDKYKAGRKLSDTPAISVQPSESPPIK